MCPGCALGDPERQPTTNRIAMAEGLRLGRPAGDDAPLRVLDPDAERPAQSQSFLDDYVKYGAPQSRVRDCVYTEVFEPNGLPLPSSRAPPR